MRCSGFAPLCLVYSSRRARTSRLAAHSRPRSTSLCRTTSRRSKSSSWSCCSVKVRYFLFRRFLQDTHGARAESFLKTLFIVSDASLTDEGSLGTSSPAWSHTDSVSIPGGSNYWNFAERTLMFHKGCDLNLGVRVRPAMMEKCPRCWTYTRPKEDDLCGRCSSVLHT